MSLSISIAGHLVRSNAAPPETAVTGRTNRYDEIQRRVGDVAGE